MLNKKFEPQFSIIIPCRNEEEYIEKCIQSLLNQEGINNSFEILVVDGMSDDDTRMIVNKIGEINRNVKLLDNPNKTTPFALNIGIDNSSGQFICILGAHSEYDKFYLKNSYDLILQHPEADCFGGPITSIGITDFGKATAIVMSSPIGVGNAKHRFPEYEGYAEMACFPVFRKVVFNKIGKYDESLTRNQDDEFCFRLRRFGGKVFISPKVKSTYYVRDSIKELFKQYFQYGVWRIIVLKKHKIPISIRQLIPATFFLLLLVLFIAGIFANSWIIALGLLVIYFSALVFFAVSKLSKNKFSVVKYIPFALFILHFAYACGFVSGIFKSPFSSKNNK